MEIGKFLVPEFIKEFNLSIDDLKKLEPIVAKLDDKHKYEEVIFRSYLENNDFILTDEQIKQKWPELGERFASRPRLASAISNAKI